MKNIIIILVFTFVLGCKKTSLYYIVENKTEFEVTIIGYDKYSQIDNNVTEIDGTLYSESFKIKPNEKYIVEIPTGDDSGGTIGIFNNESIDSVVIYFNDERRIIYVCKNLYTSNCDGKNILNRYDNFERSYDGKKTYTYTYTITQEDYDNAEPIK